MAQANYITGDWDKDFKKKDTKQTYMGKQNPMDLLTYGMKDKKALNDPFTNFNGGMSAYYDWSKNYTYDWKAPTKFDWNASTNYDWSKYATDYKGSNNGKHAEKGFGFKKPHGSHKATSVPEPSSMIMLTAGLFGLVALKKKKHA